MFDNWRYQCKLDTLYLKDQDNNWNHMSYSLLKCHMFDNWRYQCKLNILYLKGRDNNWNHMSYSHLTFGHNLYN